MTSKTSTLSKAQLKLRRSGIGASEVAAVLCKSDWQGPLDVFERKLGLRPVEPPSWPMRIGNLLEDDVIDLYTQVAEPHCALKPSTTLKHAQFPKVPILATPDRIYADGSRLVEAKTAGSYHRDRWGVDGTDQIPIDYFYQVQTQMLVTGIPVCDVAVLLSNWNFHTYVVHANEDVQKEIVEGCKRFWYDCVKRRTPPKPASDAELLRWLNHRLPNAVATTNRAGSVADEQLCRDYAEAKLARAEANARYDRARDRLCVAIGTDRGVAGAGYEAYWATVERQSVDYKTLVDTELRSRLSPETFAGLLGSHKKQSGYRRLIVKVALPGITLDKEDDE